MLVAGTEKLRISAIENQTLSLSKYMSSHIPVCEAIILICRDTYDIESSEETLESDKNPEKSDDPPCSLTEFGSRRFTVEYRSFLSIREVSKDDENRYEDTHDWDKRERHMKNPEKKEEKTNLYNT